MKALLICTVLVVFLTAWMGSKNQSPPRRQAVVATSTNAYATLGQGPNCSRHGGICSVSPPGSGQAPPPEGYLATIGFDDAGQFYIEFQLSAMPADAYVAEFGSGQFTMGEARPVPALLMQRLGRDGQAYTMPTGTYATATGAGKVKVVF